MELNWKELVVGAVLGAVAKEIAAWAFSLVKDAARAKLKAVFNWLNFQIVFNVVSLCMFVYMLIDHAWTDRPMSGKDLLIVAGLILFIIVAVFNLLWELAHASVKRAESKAAKLGGEETPLS